MGKSHKITLGKHMDAREGALDVIDPRTTARMYAALDWDYDQARRERRIALALDLLTPGDRQFARRILDGLDWRRSGMSRRGFNKRLEKICEIIVSHR